MRALLMAAASDGPDRSEVRAVSEAAPAAGEVSIEVAYAGVNFLDVMARRGDPGYVSAWPYTPGLEVAGAVRATGPGVSGLAVGQSVAAFTPNGGGLAEVALAPAALTVAVPEGVPLLVAAAAPVMLASALLLLTHAGRLSPGESVLVHSASGGVGTAVAQLVPVLGGGLRIGSVGRPEKVQAARDSGYDVAFARRDELAAQIRAAAGGVDVVLDPLGTSMLDLDLAVAAPGGRIVLFGNAGGRTPAPLPAAGRLIAGNVAVGGFSISRLAAAAPDRVAGALRRVLDLLAAERLHLPVTELGSLDDVPAVHQHLAEGRGSGKYVTRLRSAQPVQPGPAPGTW